MTFQGKAFYIDPVGNTELYKHHPEPHHQSYFRYSR